MTEDVPKGAAETLLRNNDDIIQPFQLEQTNLRGRIVRLGDALNDILTAHDYPLPVKRLMGETLLLTALLSSMLKYEGIFTLQTTGDGPVGRLVADMTSDGDIRGCAGFDAQRVEQAQASLSAMGPEESAQNHLAQLLGKGYIAFTVDQGAHTDRYQGIVELKGASLVDCVQHYFQQSEQIGTGIQMAVGQREGKWRAGGIMVQHMPEDQVNIEAAASNLKEDDWRRTMLLLDTCTDEELLSPELGENMLLMRLFHEEGIRVFEPTRLRKSCRCSSERVESILAGLPQEDLDHIVVDGKVTMTCEFCSRDYVFDPAKIQRTIEG